MIPNYHPIPNKALLTNLPVSLCSIARAVCALDISQNVLHSFIGSERSGTCGEKWCVSYASVKAALVSHFAHSHFGLQHQSWRSSGFRRFSASTADGRCPPPPVSQWVACGSRAVAGNGCQDRRQVGVLPTGVWCSAEGFRWGAALLLYKPVRKKYLSSTRSLRPPFLPENWKFPQKNHADRISLESRFPWFRCFSQTPFHGFHQSRNLVCRDHDAGLLKRAVAGKIRGGSRIQNSSRFLKGVRRDLTNLSLRRTLSVATHKENASKSSRPLIPQWLCAMASITARGHSVLYKFTKFKMYNQNKGNFIGLEYFLFWTFFLNEFFVRETSSLHFWLFEIILQRFKKNSCKNIDFLIENRFQNSRSEKFSKFSKFWKIENRKKYNFNWNFRNFSKIEKSKIFLHDFFFEQKKTIFF